MVKNIKLIAVVFLVIVSFFILLKGLNKTNNYSPNLNSSNIDFNFKAKFLYSNEKITLYELINDKDFSLINIWASWCTPCRAEHEILMKIKDLNIPIYGINYKDKLENASKFLEELGNPFFGLGFDLDGVSAITLGVYGIPETFFIDSRGVVIKRHIGPLTLNELEEVSSLLSDR